MELFKNGITSDGAQIKLMLAHIGTTSASLHTQTQIAFASCIMHLMKHGDTGMANAAQEAVASLGDGWRLNAVRDYFVKMGPLTWDSETDTLKYSKQKMEKLKPEFLADEKAFGSKLMAKAWTSFKPEQPFEGYSVIGKAMALLNKARKDLADPEKAPKLRDADTGTLDKLDAFLKQFDVTAPKKV